MSSIFNNKLLTYFKKRNNRFKNAKGMELGLSAGNELWTYFSLTNYDHGPLAISISTDGDSLTEFIEGFKVQELEDIDNLEYTNTWMRYLNGDAEISVTPMELEATLIFRIMKRKTAICSLDLHFYDEVYEHLTKPEDFEAYIHSHEKRLNLAAENRYRMNFIEKKS